jgi:GH18 family chitinase
LYKNDNETTTDEPPSFIKSRYNCNEAIQTYINVGAPSNKLVMGLALYGRGWQGKKDANLFHLCIEIFFYIMKYRSDQCEYKWIFSTHFRSTSTRYMGKWSL